MFEFLVITILSKNHWGHTLSLALVPHKSSYQLSPHKSVDTGNDLTYQYTEADGGKLTSLMPCGRAGNDHNIEVLHD